MTPAIQEKARELRDMMSNHPLTLEFRESMEIIANDRKAQELLDDMISAGALIQQSLQQGRRDAMEETEEQRQLKERFDAHPEVKRHLEVQKAYLNMLHMVMHRIMNP